MSTTNLTAPLTARAYRLQQLPAVVNMGASTIRKLRAAGQFPKPDRKYGRVELWHVATIDAWLQGRGN